MIIFRRKDKGRFNFDNEESLPPEFDRNDGEAWGFTNDQMNDSKELRKAWKRLNLLYHSDKGGDKKEAAEFNNFYQKALERLKWEEAKHGKK